MKAWAAVVGIVVLIAAVYIVILVGLFRSAAHSNMPYTVAWAAVLIAAACSTGRDGG